MYRSSNTHYFYINIFFFADILFFKPPFFSQEDVPFSFFVFFRKMYSLSITHYFHINIFFSADVPFVKPPFFLYEDIQFVKYHFFHIGIFFSANYYLSNPHDLVNCVSNLLRGQKIYFLSGRCTVRQTPIIFISIFSSLQMYHL